MKYVVDTSSLISLARYYQPFDRRSVLSNRVEQLFLKDRLILLESVKRESRRAINGMAINRLSFLEKQKTQENIKAISLKQQRKIDDGWTTRKERDSLLDEQYAAEKSKMLADADFQLILYAKGNRGVTVVTEETARPNDDKLFKKIPFICRYERVKCISLPDMLKELGLSVSYQWSAGRK